MDISEAVGSALQRDHDSVKLLNEQCLRAWDIYIKFFSVFLTVNIIALGVVIEKVDSTSGRLMISIVFAGENLLALVTGVAMTRYTARVADEVVRGGRAPLALFGRLGRWGGIANSVGHVLLFAAWVAINFAPLPGSSSTANCCHPCKVSPGAPPPSTP